MPNLNLVHETGRKTLKRSIGDETLKCSETALKTKDAKTQSARDKTQEPYWRNLKQAPKKWNRPWNHKMLAYGTGTEPANPETWTQYVKQVAKLLNARERPRNKTNETQNLSLTAPKNVRQNLNPEP